MDQVPMFFEQVEDALGYIIQALGGAKVVGAKLRPDMAENSPESAQRWVLECLNPDRPAFFHPAQVIMLLRMAREANLHNAMDWLCDRTGYAKPQPLEPQDEYALLQRQFIQAAEMLKSLTPRLDELQSHNPNMRVVK